MHGTFQTYNNCIFFLRFLLSVEKSGIPGSRGTFRICERAILLNHVRPESFVVKQSGTLHHCNFYSTHFFIEHPFFLTMRKFIQRGSRQSADSPRNMRYFYHHRIFVQVRITGQRPAGRSISCDLTRTSARRGSKTE